MSHVSHYSPKEPHLNVYPDDLACALREKIKAASVETETGCWSWTRGLDTHGYGQFRVNGRMTLAHRAAYRAFVGPIPDGLTIDHLCRNIRCVNPAHMEPVTAAENSGRRPPKTHCPRGHEYVGANLYMHPNGSPVCRKCLRVSQVKAEQKRRAA